MNGVEEVKAETSLDKEAVQAGKALGVTFDEETLRSEEGEGKSNGQAGARTSGGVGEDVTSQNTSKDVIHSAKSKQSSTTSQILADLGIGFCINDVSNGDITPTVDESYQYSDDEEGEKTRESTQGDLKVVESIRKKDDGGDDDDDETYYDDDDEDEEDERGREIDETDTAGGLTITIGSQLHGTDSSSHEAVLNSSGNAPLAGTAFMSETSSHAQGEAEGPETQPDELHENEAPGIGAPPANDANSDVASVCTRGGLEPEPVKPKVIEDDTRADEFYISRDERILMEHPGSPRKSDRKKSGPQTTVGEADDKGSASGSVGSGSVPTIVAPSVKTPPKESKGNERGSEFVPRKTSPDPLSFLSSYDGESAGVERQQIHTPNYIRKNLTSLREGSREPDQSPEHRRLLEEGYSLDNMRDNASLSRCPSVAEGLRASHQTEGEDVTGQVLAQDVVRSPDASVGEEEDGAKPAVEVTVLAPPEDIPTGEKSSSAKPDTEEAERADEKKLEESRNDKESPNDKQTDKPRSNLLDFDFEQAQELFNMDVGVKAEEILTPREEEPEVAQAVDENEDENTEGDGDKTPPKKVGNLQKRLMARCNQTEELPLDDNVLPPQSEQDHTKAHEDKDVMVTSQLSVGDLKKTPDSPTQETSALDQTFHPAELAGDVTRTSSVAEEDAMMTLFEREATQETDSQHDRGRERVLKISPRVDSMYRESTAEEDTDLNNDEGEKDEEEGTEDEFDDFGTKDIERFHNRGGEQADGCDHPLEHPSAHKHFPVGRDRVRPKHFRDDGDLLKPGDMFDHLGGRPLHASRPISRSATDLRPRRERTDVSLHRRGKLRPKTTQASFMFQGADIL